MIDVAILKAMAEAGAGVDVIIAAVEAAQAVEAEALKKKRADAAERQRQSRASRAASRNVTVTSCDIALQAVTECDTPSPLSPPSMVSPITPSLTTPSIPPSPSASLRSAGAKRATRLPEGWKPSSEDLAFAEARGLPRVRIQAEAEKFKNYWIAKSGKDATKANWPATWRNWILNTIEREGKSNGNGRRSVQEAAADLHARVAAFSEPPPSSIRDGTGEADVRLLPAR